MVVWQSCLTWLSLIFQVLEQCLPFVIASHICLARSPENLPQLQRQIFVFKFQLIVMIIIRSLSIHYSLFGHRFGEIFLPILPELLYVSFLFIHIVLELKGLNFYYFPFIFILNKKIWVSNQSFKMFVISGVSRRKVCCFLKVLYRLLIFKHLMLVHDISFYHHRLKKGDKIPNA